MFDYKAFRDLCFDKGVSESAVAKAIGLSRASVSRRKGNRIVPRIGQPMAHRAFPAIGAEPVETRKIL